MNTAATIMSKLQEMAEQPGMIDAHTWLQLFQYDDGFLYRKHTTSSKALKGDKVGWLNDTGYLITSIKGKKYRVHRIIYEMHHGPIPEKLEIDHIDGNRLNNKIENLRTVTARENCQNTRLRSDNTSGRVGVSFAKRDKYWYASIRVDGKTIPLGHYKEFNQAVKARKKAESKYNFHPNHGRK